MQMQYTFVFDLDSIDDIVGMKENLIEMKASGYQASLLPPNLRINSHHINCYHHQHLQPFYENRNIKFRVIYSSSGNSCFSLSYFFDIILLILSFPRIFIISVNCSQSFYLRLGQNFFPRRGNDLRLGCTQGRQKTGHCNHCPSIRGQRVRRCLFTTVS